METTRTFRLRASPEAPGTARAVLDAFRAFLTPAEHEDLRLLVTELVTNSVRHAGMGPMDEIRLEISIQPTVLRVAVADCGPGFERNGHAPQSGSGWGLFILGEVADRWGVDNDGVVKVWFELDRASIAI